MGMRRMIREQDGSIQPGSPLSVPSLSGPSPSQANPLLPSQHTSWLFRKQGFPLFGHSFQFSPPCASMPVAVMCWILHFKHSSHHSPKSHTCHPRRETQMPHPGIQEAHAITPASSSISTHYKGLWKPKTLKPSLLSPSFLAPHSVKLLALAWTQQLLRPCWAPIRPPHRASFLPLTCNPFSVSLPGAPANSQSTLKTLCSHQPI